MDVWNRIRNQKNTYPLAFLVFLIFPVFICIGIYYFIHYQVDENDRWRKNYGILFFSLGLTGTLIEILLAFSQNTIVRNRLIKIMGIFLLLSAANIGIYIAVQSQNGWVEMLSVIISIITFIAAVCSKSMPTKEIPPPNST